MSLVLTSFNVRVVGILTLHFAPSDLVCERRPLQLTLFYRVMPIQSPSFPFGVQALLVFFLYFEHPATFLSRGRRQNRLGTVACA